MRVDAHVHVDPIDPCCHHHSTPPPTEAELAGYVERERIDALYAIYEQASTLRKFRNCGARLVPLYWLRDPVRGEIPEEARGLKLHPVLDRYKLDLGTLSKALETAHRRDMFLFVHTEDRQPDMSRGKQFHAIARAYPDLKIVLAHAGSYAPPGRVRLKKPLQDRLRRRTCRLVKEAVQAAVTFDNVYLETSLLACDSKARILAKAPVEKLIIGTDFPILSRSRADLQSLSKQERQLMRFGCSETDIECMHRTAWELGGL